MIPRKKVLGKLHKKDWQRCELFTFMSAVCLPFDSLSTGVTGEDVMLLSGEHRSSKLLPLPSRLDSLIGDKGVQSLEVRLSLAYVCLMEDKTTLHYAPETFKM